MLNSTDTISAVAAGISLCSLSGALYVGFLIKRQVWLMDRQRETDHDRSRRQEAVNMMKFWHERTYADTVQFVATRACLDVLSDEDCKAVEEIREFYVADQHRDKFEFFFRQLDLPVTLARDGNGVRIPPDHCKTLRAYIVQYINLLEIVATSHWHHVADRKIIDEEFEHVFFAGKKFVCGAYIAATHRYPALSHIERHFKDRAGAQQAPLSKIT